MAEVLERCGGAISPEGDFMRSSVKITPLAEV